MAPVVMFFLAVATSVDALAAGITFAFLDLRLIFTLALIGITTFVFSDAGFLLGRVIGKHATHRIRIYRRRDPSLPGDQDPSRRTRNLLTGTACPTERYEELNEIFC